MPRVANAGPSVDLFCEKTGNGSSTHDVCADCLLDYGNGGIIPPMPELEPYNGDPGGEIGWQEGVDHPPYEDEHPPYRCAICYKDLTKEDN